MCQLKYGYENKTAVYLLNLFGTCFFAGDTLHPSCLPKFYVLKILFACAKCIIMYSLTTYFCNFKQAFDIFQKYLFSCSCNRWSNKFVIHCITLHWYPLMSAFIFNKNSCVIIYIRACFEKKMEQSLLNQSHMGFFSHWPLKPQNPQKAVFSIKLIQEWILTCMHGVWYK